MLCVLSTLPFLLIILIAILHTPPLSTNYLLCNFAMCVLPTGKHGILLLLPAATRTILKGQYSEN